ncbi:MAG: hypothetical protein N3B18_00745 [Desulfobacterota bacterium]|nr:hypothetical protein [Thermodesulfobacteriota bacterium]
MTDKIPTTIEELKTFYGSSIKDFIKRQCKKYPAFFALREDFEQELYCRFLDKNILLSYDPCRALFKTFLERIMHNAFISFLKSNKSIFFPFSKKDDNPLPEDESSFTSLDDEHETVKVDHDVQLVIELINRIPKIEERLLVKLKFYCERIRFSDEEVHHIAERLKIMPEQVLQTIQEMSKAKKEDAIGIRNSDICRILPYRPGSISTLFKRLVRKYILNQYIYMKTSSR